MLMTLVTILHVFACLFLVLVVLLQTGKGAEMGAVFGGGGSQTIFGASGAGNLLTKLTTATAIVFFITSLTLAWSSLARTRATVFDEPLPEPPPPAAATVLPGPEANVAPDEPPPPPSGEVPTTSGEAPLTTDEPPPPASTEDRAPSAP
jgi:preprotein translocase subunit SecG